MPGWNEVLDEIKTAVTNPFDIVRSRYLSQYFEKTGRNVICYYSSWLQKPHEESSISEADKNAFMSVIKGLDKSKGLDLILHTPGGSLVATESLVDYLWTMFDKNIRAIVPQIAMSAGTLIACSCKEIIMGTHSSLGPIDPQYSGYPAQGFLDEFNRAKKEIIENPATAYFWRPILEKYHPTFLGECYNAIELSKEICGRWLNENMFKDDPKSSSNVKKIIKALSDHNTSKTHSRHFSLNTCKEIGLKVKALEDNNDYQDCVLTLHHAYMHTFANTDAIKIIENQNGVRMVYGMKRSS